MNRKEGTPEQPGHTAVTVVDIEEVSTERNFVKIFEKANGARSQFCPFRDVIATISDKWSTLALHALAAYGTLRFNELKHLIGDISQRMLTVTLRNLEADGFITRRVYAEVPPRVEYSLTSLGRSLNEQLAQFAEWATAHGDEIIRSRNRRERQDKDQTT